MLKGLISEKEDQNYELKWQQTHNYQQLNLKNKYKTKQLDQE